MVIRKARPEGLGPSRAVCELFDQVRQAIQGKLETKGTR